MSCVTSSNLLSFSELLKWRLKKKIHTQKGFGRLNVSVPSAMPGTQKVCDKRFPFCFLLPNSFMHIALGLSRKLGKLASPRRLRKATVFSLCPGILPQMDGFPRDHQGTLEPQDLEQNGELSKWLLWTRNNFLRRPIPYPDPPRTHTLHVIARKNSQT